MLYYKIKIITNVLKNYIIKKETNHAQNFMKQFDIIAYYIIRR